MVSSSAKKSKGLFEKGDFLPLCNHHPLVMLRASHACKVKRPFDQSYQQLSPFKSFILISIITLNKFYFRIPICIVVQNSNETSGAMFVNFSFVDFYLFLPNLHWICKLKFKCLCHHNRDSNLLINYTKLTSVDRQQLLTAL